MGEIALRKSIGGMFALGVPLNEGFHSWTVGRAPAAQTQPHQSQGSQVHPSAGGRMCDESQRLVAERTRDAWEELGYLIIDLQFLLKLTSISSFRS